MNMTHFTTITHLLILVSYTETIHSIDQLYIKQFTLQISWYWNAIFSYSTNKAICWKSSFMLISWKAALSSCKDSYFFTTNPWRLKKEIIMKLLLYIWLPHWLFSLSHTHTFTVHVDVGSERKSVPDAWWKWWGFNENLHHPLFAFLAWGIHIYLHCL